jgi:membrane protein YdbS with pleckstrin-like domain
MTGSRSGALLRILRVPPEPHLPAGDPGSARVFRAGANFWNLKLLGWLIHQAFVLAGFVFAMVAMHAASKADVHLGFFRVVEMLVFAVWLVFVPVTLAILRLDYELRWYIVTDRAARLREGILNLREMTFTLANVQDIRIQQGPLQRLLGLADVELRTAGGGDEAVPRAGRGAGESRSLHIARFRGVEDAEEIRDLVVDRMKKARGAGLGDPDDAPRPPRPASADLHAAARALAEESGRLRAAVEARAG